MPATEPPSHEQKPQDQAYEKDQQRKEKTWSAQKAGRHGVGADYKDSSLSEKDFHKDDPSFPKQEELEDPFKHREWPTFQERCAKFGMGGAKAKFLWQLMIVGVRDGNQANFDMVADAIFEHMQVPPDKAGKMALWSGGIETSHYAEGLGYATLEGQRFYQLTDGLKVFEGWLWVWPLWATLSRKFISQCKGEVHAFLAQYRDASIFGEIEKATVLGNGAKMKYHALVGPMDGLYEVNAEGDKVKNEGHASLGAWTKALKAAKAKNHKVHQAV